MSAPVLLRRYRISLGLFVFGLIASGLTAFPLLKEVRVLASWLGITAPERYLELHGLQHWIAYVLFGLEQTYERFPFFGYGTDWLAFGHLAVAVFFLRGFLHPEDSDWVLKCGLACCVGVIPLALIAGSIREIPFYWRLVDCSFGVFGMLPLWYCLHLSKRIRLTRGSASDLGSTVR